MYITAVCTSAGTQQQYVPVQVHHSSMYQCSICTPQQYVPVQHMYTTAGPQVSDVYNGGTFKYDFNALKHFI
jgi:hypothetical protein